MKRLLAITLAAGSTFMLVACENLPYSYQTQGAAFGAAAGGVLGHAIGGSTAATIGGAVVGGAVGAEVGRRR